VPNKNTSNTTKVARTKHTSSQALEKHGIGFDDFVNSLTDYVTVVDTEYNIVFANKVVLRTAPHKIMGTSVFLYVPEDEQEKVKQKLDGVMSNRQPVGHDLRSNVPGVGAVWFSGVASPIIKRGRVVGIVIVARDVTTKKNYEETLLRDILDKKRCIPLEHRIPDEIFLVNREGRFLDFSLTRDFEPYVPPESFIGKRLDEVMPQEVALRALKILKEAFETKIAQIYEYELTQNGAKRHFEARFIVMHDDECMIIVRDTTDTLGLREEFLKLVSEEQKRMGHNLHDGLSQHLTGIAFLGKDLENRLKNRGLKEAGDAKKITHLVNEAIDHTRRLAQGMHLVEIETSELKDVLAELCTTTEKIYRIACRLEYDNGVQFDDVDVKMHIYRIVQEAINNAIRHGGAKAIDIKVRKHPEGVRFVVADNGNGIENNFEAHGAGFKIMKYRAQMINATMRVKSQLGTGTQISFDMF